MSLERLALLAGERRRCQRIYVADMILSHTTCEFYDIVTEEKLKSVSTSTTATYGRYRMVTETRTPSAHKIFFSIWVVL